MIWESAKRSLQFTIVNVVWHVASYNKSYPTFLCDSIHTHNISLLTSERYAQLMFAHNNKLTSLMLLLQHVIQDSVLTKNFVDMIFYKIFLDIKKNSNRYRYIPFHSRCRLPRYSFWEDHYRDIAFHLRFLLDFPWFLIEILYKIISCKVFCIKLHDRLVWSLTLAIVTYGYTIAFRCSLTSTALTSLHSSQVSRR